MKDSRKKSRSKAAAATRAVRTASAPPAPKVAVEVTPAAIPVTAPPAAVPAARPARVVLGTACTIQEAAAVRAHLLEKAALPGPYEIDGGSVEMVDTAGVQLVVAFALDCLEKGTPYKWVGRSATLNAAIDQLGVGALLEYPA